MAWPIVSVGGVDYYQFEGEILLPVLPDPTGESAQIILRPEGGIGVGVPAIEQGEDGVPPELDSNINVTELAWDDPTAPTGTWTLLDPGPPPQYAMNLSLHKGPPGEDGDTVVDPTDFGTPVYKKILVVNADGTNFEYWSQRVGDRWIPASITSASSGNAGFTLCTVGIPAQGFDWRPEVFGQCIVTGTGGDVRADFVARLNNETAGNIVGRGLGMPGINPPPHILTSVPPPGANDAYDRVAEGAAAVVFFRIERQTGSETFTTSNSTTLCGVRVAPIP